LSYSQIERVPLPTDSNVSLIHLSLHSISCEFAVHPLWTLLEPRFLCLLGNACCDHRQMGLTIRICRIGTEFDKEFVLGGNLIEFPGRKNPAASSLSMLFQSNWKFTSHQKNALDWI
jgi:hypothetical protein